ncbi:hypothetical protein BDZ45DRAFT_386796 [Acephala macrosclerotiorum]|nr:hypothetical protein BDZ45DRAFT_386796 [Acephala macrosclerotiorum]
MRDLSIILLLLYLQLFITFSHAQHPLSLALFKANVKCVGSFFDQCSSCQNYARSVFPDSSFDNTCTCGEPSYQTAAYISECVSQVGLDIYSDFAISSAVSVYSVYCFAATSISPGVVTTTSPPPYSSTDSRAVPAGRIDGTLTQTTARPSPPEFCDQIWTIGKQQYPTVMATQSKVEATQKFSICKMIQWPLVRIPLICLTLLFVVQRCRLKTISTCIPALRVIISMWTNLVDAILWHIGSYPSDGDVQHTDCKICRSRLYMRSGLAAQYSVSDSEIKALLAVPENKRRSLEVKQSDQRGWDQPEHSRANDQKPASGPSPGRTNADVSASSSIGQASETTDIVTLVESLEDSSIPDAEGNLTCGDQSKTDFSWLHIVVLDKKFGKKQVPINIAKYKTDYEVFVKLNSEWRKHRGRWRALTCLKDIRLTKYRLFNKQNVCIIHDPQRPCLTMPDLDNPVYYYSYTPAHLLPEHPIIDSAILRHMFYHPSGSVYSGVADRECRNRLPKRKTPLIYIPNQGHPVGWGIEFVEGFNWKFMGYGQFLIFFTTILFSLLWSVFARESDKFSTAMTIGQWLFGAGQVGNALVLMLSEMVNFWRY